MMPIFYGLSGLNVEYIDRLVARLQYFQCVSNGDTEGLL